MDFLDPRKRRARKIELLVGYFLVGVMLTLGTIILLDYVHGYSLNKKGQVIQSGLVFISSTPAGAKINVSGTSEGTTNARVTLPSGQYLMQLNRTGYRTWSRAFNVDGGSVQHFDYPFLIPTKLTTKNTQTYTSQPQLITESPNRQWLLVEQPGTTGTFSEYNLNNPGTAPTTVSIPSDIMTPATGGSQSLTMVQWSTDNQHVILQHTFAGGSEYILFDRQTPTDSVNLDNTLGVGLASTPGTISFVNNKYDQYYLYNSTTEVLSTVTLSNPAPTKVLDDVLAYYPYGSSIVVYATTKGAPSGEVSVRILDGSNTYDIRYLSANTSYLLNLAQYSGNWFLAVGAASENKVYVYENAEQDLQGQPDQPVIPVDVLKVIDPTYVSFSPDTRMLVAENGDQFAVYDDLTGKDYNYTISDPLDAPQAHAAWMTGEQMTLVSNDRVIMFDFDGANQQTLSTAIAFDGVFFDAPYKYMYTVGPNTNSRTAPTDPYVLTNTALRTPADI